MGAPDLMVPVEAGQVGFVDPSEKAVCQQAALCFTCRWCVLSLPAGLASPGAAQGCSGQDQH